MAYKFNPFTGKLDQVGAGGGGGGTPGGSDTQVQFNDGGTFGGDAGLTYNKTTDELTLAGDLNLDDGVAGNTTTVQAVTPTANRTISFPDATGTVALVAGSSGQVTYNNAGAQAGLTSANIGSTGAIDISLAGAASTPPVTLTGSWFTGGTATTTKPQLLIEPTGTTSTAWNTGGTGLGLNAPSSFSGKIIDLQKNGSSLAFFGSDGSLSTPNIYTTGSNFTVLGTELKLRSTAIFGWTAGSSNASLELSLARDDANILAQRNGTNAQTFRLYNTYTDASNYERGFLQWNSNVLEIGSEGAGTGSEQPVRITAATLKLPNLPTYADNAAATTGGLVAGDVYKTATGELRITV